MGFVGIGQSMYEMYTYSTNSYLWQLKGWQKDILLNSENTCDVLPYDLKTMDDDYLRRGNSVYAFCLQEKNMEYFNHY